MPSNDSPLNLVRGPARYPGWAQLIRLGGDGVAILFGELRKLVARIDGVVERLHYSAGEERWVVQYRMGDTELFTVRILPGLLEADIAMNQLDVESLLRNRNLSGAARDAIRAGGKEPSQSFIQFALKDRRMVRAFANLVRAKSSVVSNSRGGHLRTTPDSSKTKTM